MKKTMQKLDIDEFEVTMGALIGVLCLIMVVEMYVRMFLMWDTKREYDTDKFIDYIFQTKPTFLEIESKYVLDERV